MRTIRRVLSTWTVSCLLGALSAAQTPADPKPGPQEPPNPPGPTNPGGGSYGGPGDTVPGGPGDTGGGQGGGAGPGAPTPGQPIPGSAPPLGPGSWPGGRPATGGNGISVLQLAPDTATWEAWWTLNRDRYLNVKAAIYAADASAAPATGGTGLARRRPDPRFVADRVLPILSAIVERDADPGLVSEALIALARADAGRGLEDATSQRVTERIVRALAHRQLAVAESAAISLGIQGGPRAIPVLAGLVEDSAAGRAACGRAEVPTRMRSLAALSLGTAARRGREELQRYAVSILSRRLEARATVPQDLAGSCAAALGLVRLGAGPTSDQDLPAAASAGALIHFLQRVADDPERDQIVRAQATASVGRVGALSPEPQRAAAIAWAIAAATDAAHPTPVRQGAAIALGRLGRPTDSPPDRAARSALTALARDTDRLVRGLAWLARGEIGSRARVEAEKEPAVEIQNGLLAELQTAKGGASGFVTLALGVLAHDSALVAAADGNLGLKQAWPRARTTSDVSATGLALGLRLDASSAPLILERFGREGDPLAKSSLALGLGLAGATTSLSALRTASATDNHPLVIRDAAIGRALLADETVGPEMLSLLARTKSLLTADYAADALGSVGDASALDTLAALLRDEEVPAARRARLVRALGAVADASLLPWNEPLRADGHFGAPTESWSAFVLR